MSNTINPYSTSRAHLQQRPESAAEQEEELLPGEMAKTDKGARSQNQANNVQGIKNEALEEAEKLAQPQDVEESAPNKFINTLEGAIERKEDISLASENSAVTSSLPGLSMDERQMIYRYFPVSPSLELRLYNPDMSTNKVDPGSVGSRVDLRG